MYSADRNFLLLRLRSFTFGPELQASYTCPACGAADSSMIEDLDELPVRALADGEMPEDILVELEDGYVDRDGSVHTALTLRLPRGDDEDGGRAADAQERLARQERAARPLPASARRPAAATAWRRSGRRSSPT